MSQLNQFKKTSQPPTGGTVTTEQPVVASSPAHMPWLEAADAYLTGKGWKKMGTNDLGFSVWEDPVSVANNKGEAKEGARLPLQGSSNGETIPVLQMHTPAAPWVYSTQEAMVIQRGRDEATEKKKK